MTSQKILVAVSEKKFQHDLQSMLLEIGLNQIRIIDDIEVAGSAVESFQPDLVISEIFFASKPKGIQFAKELLAEDIPVILVTANSTTEVYEAARAALPIAYLVKPFARPSLQAAIERGLKDCPNRRLPYLVANSPKQHLANSFLFVKKGTALIKIAIKDIDFIEADGNYCYIYIEGKKYAVKSSLRSLKSKLEGEGFLQSNRGTLVNFSRIQRISFSEGIIELDQQQVAIGDKYRSEVSNWARRV